ncbi:MAG: HAD hydrolase-like protein [Candidatus Thiodiazotropha sp. (ex. Lucinisca nassula)]|uniref:HAD family hydrolase n=1 Tax=Candidatus Thiodiazotropha sp. LNASS1 TaxID=3096260 RepID=UPI000D3AD1BC|nr:HAD hydrolase-like protein [Candidatus Thiodiazotropha sp. (ex. Lucinisca nassula)]MBW9274090.1 HAD hydrolase-like protein [Candidatus Thiodiazotropha sp. (ex. Lucinisca nassula)]PUB80957.1 MAG: haloacid dehalogenase [gamma proteobacterium symbiont of Ctena orbiculata]PUB91834.1 MAG: haloacid dehalogenase [gamma proteobacterium symbiont of Ctena orbiculata]
MFDPHRLIILDADGTTVDAFKAINMAFKAHNMNIGDIQRFQDRRKIFKYIGGLKEMPINLRKQLKEKQRSALINTLTEIYREQARLFDGMGWLINRLVTQPDLRVGMITRNITIEPEKTLRKLYRRNGVDDSGLDFLIHLPLRKQKLTAFQAIRESLKVNPARAYATGDEKCDYVAAVGTGMHPFMVSFGFESYRRLTKKIGVPAVLISRQPHELKQRILHALDLS